MDVDGALDLSALTISGGGDDVDADVDMVDAHHVDVVPPPPPAQPPISNKFNITTGDLHISIDNHFHHHHHHQPTTRAQSALPSSLSVSHYLLLPLVSAILLHTVKSIYADLHSTWNIERLQSQTESLDCWKNYYSNKCDAVTVLPALAAKCKEWENCIHQHDTLNFHKRSILTAKLLGSILNSLIDPIGWKALTTIIALLVSILFIYFFFLKQTNNNNNSNTQTVATIPPPQ